MADKVLSNVVFKSATVIRQLLEVLLKGIKAKSDKRRG
jgi:hypothetical protein